MATAIPSGLTTIAQAVELSQQRDLELSQEAIDRITACRSYLDMKLSSGNDTYYGINTGFGSLEKVRISNDKIEELQLNLVRSHACGTGAPVSEDIVRLMLLLKIITLSKGKSGVRADLVQRLVDFLNNDIHPVVNEQGSLGASGDLAPLAHLSLPLIGEGEVTFGGRVRNAAEVLTELNLEPLQLKAKEGLAMLNGTQLMSAYGCIILNELQSLVPKIDLIAATSVDAFGCRLDPFEEAVHAARGHEGQEHVAAHIRSLLEGSELSAQAKGQTQDPYSFRCIPQVHGASRDAVVHAMMVFETEINSVTDNPLILPEEDKIISGGNFHGQPLALSLDYLTMAIAELSSISERRTYLLLSGKRGLPEFLAAEPGLHSGLMIAQYTAAALVGENRQLSMPASTDNAQSSNGQEDHVSMGARAAVKSLEVLRNLEKVLAIEWICAAQALEHRKPQRSSPGIEEATESLRTLVAPVTTDRALYQDIELAVGLLRED